MHDACIQIRNSERNDKPDLTEIKFSALKKTLSRKREATNRETIWSKYLSDQRLEYEVYKGFISLNTKKMNDLDRNRVVDWGWAWSSGRGVDGWRRGRGNCAWDVKLIN